jgi:selenide,water dikinase
MTTGQKRLVLLGGGHAHVFVLRALGLEPLPGVDVTLVAKELDAPYSGMLPGFVAGHYTLPECQIDLRRLAAFAGAELIAGAAVGIDRGAQTVMIEGHQPVPYDVLSIDIGITPDLSGIAGAEEHALIVKPVSLFAPKWLKLEARADDPDGPRRIVAVGGGAAGVELILAARHRLRERAVGAGRNPDEFTFTLVTDGVVLSSHNSRAQRLVRAALAQAAVNVLEHVRVIAIGPASLTLSDGRELACDAALVSTRAKAANWLKTTGLQLDDAGFLALDPALHVLNDPSVFAAGDCASVIAHPRPKAGVFAVRQGPVLAQNLRRVLLGGSPQRFIPQRAFLTLISLGEKRAVAARGPWAAAGRWAWVWKDWIDRRFMAMFQTLGP